MEKIKFTKGQSLIEILFAIAIFTIGVVTVGYLIFDSFASLRYRNDLTQARFLAREGIEAVRSLRDSGFDTLRTGTYGLVLQNNQWALATSTDVIGKFRRTITINDSDDEVKSVTATVYWPGPDETTEKTISFTTTLSNWMQTGGEAERLDVTIDTPMLSASSTVLTSNEIRNNGDTNITIVGMTVAWGTIALLTRITIQGTDVFTASTSAPATSGQFINIADFTISPYTGFYSLDAIAFDGSVANTDFVVTFTLADTSKRYVLISL